MTFSNFVLCQKIEISDLSEIVGMNHFQTVSIFTMFHEKKMNKRDNYRQNRAIRTADKILPLTLMEV